MTKLFIAGGIGCSRISEKLTRIMISTNHNASPATTQTLTDSHKAKAKNNFSWLLGLGAGFEVTDAVTIDVQYNYQDFGKSSGGKIDDVNTAPKSAYRSHAIKAGVRFDI